MSLTRQLHDRLADGFSAVAGREVDPVVRPSRLADYQSDAAMQLSGPLGRPPRAIAQEVIASSELDDLCSDASVSGPGFINLTLRTSVIEAALTSLASDDRLGVPRAGGGLVVIDYSAPNVAKEMHVGHLRSTIIGDAAARFLEWLGYDVSRQNHLGDWGTPFGMLVEYLVDVERDGTPELSVKDLDTFYKHARGRFDADPGFQRRARDRVVLLQSHDADSLDAWNRLLTVSRSYFLSVYAMLGVTLTEEDFVGESDYQDELEPAIDELSAKGLLEDSEGALCAFVDDFVGRDGQPQPLIVRKSDGGYGYAATDLAAIRRRTVEMHASRLLYVVGLPQRQHLAMVFAVARRAGWLEHGRAEHIGFGSILGSDGKMLRSRSGSAVRLVDLLTVAVERASDLIREKSPDVPDDEREALARSIGIGAVKYADLSTDRNKDYVFDLNRMLSLEGDTAPYLQYAVARIRSIFRRAPRRDESSGAIRLAEGQERDLALQILRFQEVVPHVERTLEFHRLTGYFFGLATAFSVFYESCPVLRAPEETRGSRLGLCYLTAETLVTGLALLGIDAPERL